jgi:hypothetical protein
MNDTNQVWCQNTVCTASYGCCVGTSFRHRSAMYRALCSVNLLAGPHDIAKGLASGTLHECRVHITAHRASRRAAMTRSGQHLRSTPFEYFGAQVGRWRHDGGQAVEIANRASCPASYSTKMQRCYGVGGISDNGCHWVFWRTSNNLSIACRTCCTCSAPATSAAAQLPLRTARPIRA